MSLDASDYLYSLILTSKTVIVKVTVIDPAPHGGQFPIHHKRNHLVSQAAIVGVIAAGDER